MKTNSKIHLLLILLSSLVVSCKTTKKAMLTGNDFSRIYLDDNTYLVTEVSSDSTYGFTEENPVKVGGVDKTEGPSNERRFLNALTGQKGERIAYKRQGSCCHFKTKNGLLNDTGLLDRYAVYQVGSTDTLVLFLNMYDYDVLKVPVGFKAKQ